MLSRVSKSSSDSFPFAPSSPIFLWLFYKHDMVYFEVTNVVSATELHKTSPMIHGTQKSNQVLI